MVERFLPPEAPFMEILQQVSRLPEGGLEIPVGSVVPKFGGHVDAQEIGLPVSSNGLVLPCGASGRWERSKS